MKATQPARGNKIDGADHGRLARLGHFTTRYRWPVIAAWIVLTLFGGYAAGQLSSRWYQSLAVPGKPAYEASQRTFKAFGAGVRSPNTVVFHSVGRRRQQEPGGACGDGAGGEGEPRRAHELVLLDRQLDVRVATTGTRRSCRCICPAEPGLDVKSGAAKIRAAAAAGLPAGISVDVTGRDALGEASDARRRGRASSSRR